MEQFDICLVEFVYREDVDKPNQEQRVKYRPCLVLSNNIITPIAQITKHEPRDNKDYRIKNWRESGLDLPSTIRFGQQIQASNNDLKKIGHLTNEDIEEIQKLNLLN